VIARAACSVSVRAAYQNSLCGFLSGRYCKARSHDPKSVRVTTMIDEKWARRRAHENNIARYIRLLQTDYRMLNVTSSRAALPRSRLLYQRLPFLNRDARRDRPVLLIDKHSMEANPHYWFYPIGLLTGARQSRLSRSMTDNIP
jgi:hypothetical protein